MTGFKSDRWNAVALVSYTVVISLILLIIIDYIPGFYLRAWISSSRMSTLNGPTARSYPMATLPQTSTRRLRLLWTRSSFTSLKTRRLRKVTLNRLGRDRLCRKSHIQSTRERLWYAKGQWRRSLLLNKLQPYPTTILSNRNNGLA